MYGMINSAIKDYVIAEHGFHTWKQVASQSAVGDAVFTRMTSYPDEITYELVGAIAQVTSTGVETVLDRFGEFWIAYTAKRYAPLFEIAGDSLRGFLMSLNMLHERVAKSFNKLVPPSFTFDEVDARTLRMHYVSHRAGLCPMVLGLLRGLAKRFDTPIQVSEVACSRKGANHCEFIVIFPGDASVAAP